MHRRFEKKTHASLYRLHRPKTPEFIVEAVVRYVKEKRPPHLAIDVGCGSGQNTFVFAKYFDEVIGTDISPAQLLEAEVELQCQGSPNVRFAESSAEDMSAIVNDHSADLLVGAACFHWFDLTKLYTEARRILAPNGTVAAICYSTHKLYHPTDTNKEELLCKINNDLLSMSSWTLPSAIYDIIQNLYGNLPFPFDDVISLDPKPHQHQISLTDLLGHASTWSSFQKLPSDEAADVLESLKKDVLHLYDYPETQNSDEAVVHIILTYYCLLGRVP